ncbi:hypothetical protein HAX54_025893, partial [Datura stramonium]|nr:hypothetical protein [Datura stramonium]
NKGTLSFMDALKKMLDLLIPQRPASKEGSTEDKESSTRQQSEVVISIINVVKKVNDEEITFCKRGKEVEIPKSYENISMSDDCKGLWGHTGGNKEGAKIIVMDLDQEHQGSLTENFTNIVVKVEGKMGKSISY